MTAFYVGQRVRVVCETSIDHGAETAITRLDVFSYNGGGYFYVGHEVDIPIGNHALFEGDSVVFEPHQLEPITKLEDTTVAWDEMPCDRSGKFRVTA